VGCRAQSPGPERIPSAETYPHKRRHWRDGSPAASWARANRSALPVLLHAYLNPHQVGEFRAEIGDGTRCPNVVPMSDSGAAPPTGWHCKTTRWPAGTATDALTKAPLNEMSVVIACCTVPSHSRDTSRNGGSRSYRRRSCLNNPHRRPRLQENYRHGGGEE
jgi:hypothetical protein